MMELSNKKKDLNHQTLGSHDLYGLRLNTMLCLMVTDLNKISFVLA